MPPKKQLSAIIGASEIPTKGKKEKKRRRRVDPEYAYASILPEDEDVETVELPIDPEVNRFDERAVQGNRFPGEEILDYIVQTQKNRKTRQLVSIAGALVAGGQRIEDVPDWAKTYSREERVRINNIADGVRRLIENDEKGIESFSNFAVKQKFEKWLNGGGSPGSLFQGHVQQYRDSIRSSSSQKEKESSLMKTIDDDADDPMGYGYWGGVLNDAGGTLGAAATVAKVMGYHTLGTALEYGAAGVTLGHQGGKILRAAVADAVPIPSKPMDSAALDARLNEIRLARAENDAYNEFDAEGTGLDPQRPVLPDDPDVSSAVALPSAPFSTSAASVLKDLAAKVTSILPPVQDEDAEDPAVNAAYYKEVTDTTTAAAAAFPKKPDQKKRRLLPRMLRDYDPKKRRLEREEEKLQDRVEAIKTQGGGLLNTARALGSGFEEATRMEGVPFGGLYRTIGDIYQNLRDYPTREDYEKSMNSAFISGASPGVGSAPDNTGVLGFPHPGKKNFAAMGEGDADDDSPAPSPGGSGAPAGPGPAPTPFFQRPGVRLAGKVLVGAALAGGAAAAAYAAYNYGVSQPSSGGGGSGGIDRLEYYPNNQNDNNYDNESDEEERMKRAKKKKKGGLAKTMTSEERKAAFMEQYAAAKKGAKLGEPGAWKKTGEVGERMWQPGVLIGRREGKFKHIEDFRPKKPNYRPFGGDAAVAAVKAAAAAKKPLPSPAPGPPPPPPSQPQPLIEGLERRMFPGMGGSKKKVTAAAAAGGGPVPGSVAYIDMIIKDKQRAKEREEKRRLWNQQEDPLGKGDAIQDEDVGTALDLISASEKKRDAELKKSMGTEAYFAYLKEQAFKQQDARRAAAAPLKKYMKHPLIKKQHKKAWAKAVKKLEPRYGYKKYGPFAAYEDKPAHRYNKK